MTSSTVKWGGETRLQPQGGILTPREAPIIAVVTGEAGGQYGYADFWDEHGVFHYYGAGQIGDMEFLRGNLALRDHVDNGEDVHVFEQETAGLRYVGQLVVAGYYEVDGVPDRNGDPRRAIVFELVPLDRHVVAPAQVVAPADGRWTMPLEELRERAARTLGQQPNARERPNGRTTSEART